MSQSLYLISMHWDSWWGSYCLQHFPNTLENGTHVFKIPCRTGIPTKHKLAPLRGLWDTGSVLQRICKIWPKFFVNLSIFKIYEQVEICNNFQLYTDLKTSTHITNWYVTLLFFKHTLKQTLWSDLYGRIWIAHFLTSVLPVYLTLQSCSYHSWGEDQGVVRLFPLI